MLARPDVDADQADRRTGRDFFQTGETTVAGE
jgi:hypothetical protein